MPLKFLLGCTVFTMCSAGMLWAQEPQPQLPEVGEKLLLREGADVSLKFAQDLSSKTAVDDDPLSLVLDEDIKVGDAVIVKAGAKAVGTITHAKKAGMMGKAGELKSADS